MILKKTCQIFCQPNWVKRVYALILAVIGVGSAVGTPALAADPSVNVAAPSNEFGDAGAALGNVWNMNNLNDVAWKQPNNSNQTVQYTVQNAGDSGVPAGAFGQVLKGVTPKGSDLVSAFYTNADVSIPSQTYRYLIYRSAIAPHQPGEDGFPKTNARILYSSRWGDNWLFEAFPYRRYSDAQRVQECPPGSTAVYGKWCTYFIDLTQNINGPGSPNPWDWGQPGAEVKAFGLWPHENWCTSNCSPSGDSPNFFYLDFVYLAGEIVAKHPTYNYTVKWNVTDPDGGQLTSTLYYQQQDELLTPAQSPSCTAANLAAAWTPIPGGVKNTTVAGSPSQYQLFLPVIAHNEANTGFGSGDSGAFNQTFDWNLSGGSYSEGKVYYVCVEVKDADNNKTYGVSSAPVIKAPAPTVLN